MGVKEALLVQNVLLGEVCTITYGKGLSTKQLLNTGFPVFGANGIIGFYDKYIYEKSEVLISCRGAYSGKINLSPPNCFVTNNSLILSIKDDKSLSKKYLYYILNSVNKSKLVTGTAQPQVTINNAVNLSFPLPEIEVQNAIVEKIEELFSELDKSIENLKTAQQQLKVYRQAVLKWAFEGKLTNEEVKDGELPEGWEWKQLGNVASRIFDGPFGSNLKSDDYVANGVRVIRLENIGVLEFKDEYKTYISNEKFALLKKHNVVAGDMIFSSFIIEKVRVVVLPSYIKGAVNKADCFCVRVNHKEVDKNYLAYFLSTKNIYNQLIDNVHGVTRPRVNTTQLKLCIIPMCNFAHQQYIVQEIESRLSVCDKMEETITTSLQQAEALRQSILKRAFEGKLVGAIHESPTI